MPLVSVIIPTYNRASLIPETIESVLDQSFRDFEIIVVDDGSTDNTPGIISTYPVTYIRKANQGVPNARNTGIRASQGKYIAILDSDDCLVEQSLEKRVKLLEQHPEVGFVYGQLYTMGENSQVTGLYKLPIKNPGIRRKEIELHDLLYLNHVPASSVMMRRSCLEKVGLFNPDFIHGQEDLEMWVRLSSEYNSAYIAEPLIKLRLHPQRLTTQLDLQYIENNHRIIVESVLQNPEWGPRFIHEHGRIYSSLNYVIADEAYMRRNFRMVRLYTLRALRVCPSGFFTKTGLFWVGVSLMTFTPHFIFDFLRSGKHYLYEITRPRAKELF